MYSNVAARNGVAVGGIRGHEDEKRRVQQ